MNLDPALLLAKFRYLKYKSGFVLRGYQHFSSPGGNGDGHIVAMPEDAPFSEPEVSSETRSANNPPIPPEALDDFMMAIEGDGSPEAYMSASIFSRAAKQLGYCRPGPGWPGRWTLFKSPFQRKGGEDEFWIRDRHWNGGKPERWKPAFQIVDGRPTITFNTFSSDYSHDISSTVDTFTDKGMAFQSKEIVIGWRDDDMTYGGYDPHEEDADAE